MNWTEWTTTPPHEHVVYMRCNTSFTCGIGRSHLKNKNERVNPYHTLKQVATKKDGGKAFYALFVAKLLQEPVKLYWMPDESPMVSKISSELELKMKAEKLNGKFIRLNNEFLTKVDFADTYVVTAVTKRFGVDSEEHKITVNAAGDGDVWGRVCRHPITKAAMWRVMEEFLWVDP